MNQEPLPAALAAYAGAGEWDAPYELLAEREDGTVVRCGEIVAKAHAGDSDRAGLAVRMRIAADEALAGVLLAPLRPEVGYLGGRPVSLWPYGAPVDPERPEDAPWEAAARLLAALHQVPVHRLPGPVPPMRGPAKLARALRRLARATAPGRAAGGAGGGPGGAAGPVGVPAAPGAAGSAGPAGSRTGSALVPSPAEGRPAGDLVRAAARTLPAWVRGRLRRPGAGRCATATCTSGSWSAAPDPAGAGGSSTSTTSGSGPPPGIWPGPPPGTPPGCSTPAPGSASSTRTARPAAPRPGRRAPTPGRNWTSPRGPDRADCRPGSGQIGGKPPPTR